VTGNMDAKDAQQINDKFNFLKENKNQIKRYYFKIWKYYTRHKPRTNKY